ncbi:MAG: alpha-ketoglutarate-dependent dioxygenase AlkB [Gammaproteobacteria bacterium]|nr:alpha-ketoglutarate-dependent dioxygenase AlkB [Gammaproteobacteria bacterium]
MTQAELFTSTQTQLVNDESGQLIYWPNWLDAIAADEYFAALVQTVAWSQPELFLYGRRVKTPRLVAWYGDPNAQYRYSGQTHQPLPWLPILAKLRDQLSADFAIPLNSVLLNYYRDGHDAMGWHSDDEPELGRDPNVLSLSLGAERYFDYRTKQGDKPKQRINLQPGSLLLMRAAFQQFWQHSVPRQLRVKTGRINLTFRYIQPSD